jgi:hypothetical protein
MTEQEWLACADATLMLNHLGTGVTERKLRLFAVACCRHIWHLLPDERSRTAVAVAEQYADRQASDRQQAGVLKEAIAASTTGRAAWAAYWAAKKNIGASIGNTCVAAVEAGARHAVGAASGSAADPLTVWDVARMAGSREQARLLRDILGNPFRPALVDSAWLRWQGGLVVSMARQVYEERRFADLPVLADALEDAGCDAADVLEHCRAGGEHVRGCWALDLLLGNA